MKRPISNEEKHVPAVVERLLQEVKRKDLLLAAKAREVQDREDELDRVRAHPRFDDRSAMSVHEHASHQSGFDMETLVHQYWLAGVTAFAILMALLALY